MNRHRHLVAIAGIVLLPTLAHGLDPTPRFRLTDPTASRVGDEFGQSAEIQGNRILVGAGEDPSHAPSGGQAYLFDLKEGRYVQTFRDPTPTNHDRFGFDVSLDGDVVLVGAPQDISKGLSVGQAHLFEASTGKLLHTLNDPTPTSYDVFGVSVSVRGGHALVGAPGDDTFGTIDGPFGPDAGQAHLFDVASGTLLHTFNIPSPTVVDRFGQSVALSSGYALISAGGYDGDGFLNSGEAYLFDTASGMLVHTFENPTPENNAGFGGVVAMHGDYALIADFAGRGKAHLFDITTRELVRTFVNPGRSTSYFGQAMAMNDHFALIGAPIGRGSAYLFDLASGELLHTFANPSPEQYDRYAIGVALGPHHAFVGQVPNAVTSPVSGEAFVYYVVPEPPAATPLMLALVLSCCLFRRLGPRFSTES